MLKQLSRIWRLLGATLGLAILTSCTATESLLASFSSMSPEAQAFQERCELGDGMGCTQLAIMYEKGEGVGQNLATSQKLLEKACELNESNACGFLALMYHDGTDPNHDATQSAQLLKKSCDLNNSRACFVLGNM